MMTRHGGFRGFESLDGKWLLFNRRDQLDSDIMLVENFK